MSDSLRVNDYMVGLAPLPVIDNIIDNALLVEVIFFRKQNILRTVGNTAPERYVARISSHNLYDTASLMGGRGIPHLVDRLHGRIDCRVKADRILRTRNIQVNGSRNADGVDPVPCQRLGTPVGTVPSDYDNSVDSVLFTDLGSLCLALLGLELRTAGRSQNSTASLNGVGHILFFHIYDFFV